LFEQLFRIIITSRGSSSGKDTLDSHGFGMSSVRFICGTQDIHKTLEQKIANFYGTEDTIYAAAFDANGGFSSHY
jgi:glycine C-acetyltransferase